MNDNEVVDADWLYRLGFSDSALGRNQKRFVICEDAIRILGEATHGPKCWDYSLWVGKHKVFDNPTRGDVRLLCRALHVVTIEEGAT